MSRWACLVWSCDGHVQSDLPKVVVYNLMHVPDSDMCKNINARMHDSSSSSSDFVVTKYPLQLGENLSN